RRRRPEPVLRPRPKPGTLGRPSVRECHSSRAPSPGRPFTPAHDARVAATKTASASELRAWDLTQHVYITRSLPVGLPILELRIPDWPGPQLVAAKVRLTSGWLEAVCCFIGFAGKGADRTS